MCNPGSSPNSIGKSIVLSDNYNLSHVFMILRAGLHILLSLLPFALGRQIKNISHFFQKSLKKLPPFVFVFVFNRLGGEGGVFLF